MQINQDGSLTITITDSIVIDVARWYKHPRRIYGKDSQPEYFKNGDTITFRDQAQLLRALAGELTHKLDVMQSHSVLELPR
jgi:hypothetical protein